MPIRCPIEARPLSKDEYHRLDYKVMGIVFGIHNEFGCLCDEKVYALELCERCRSAGFDAKLEVPIEVSHDTFDKIYYADLIVDGRILYELKAADAISPHHRQQTLNYLFLTGLQHGKLVNMGSPSVQSEFVTTTLTTEDRYGFEIVSRAWLDLGKDSVWLRELVAELVSDWGVFLDIQLFRDAIDHFRDRDPRSDGLVEIANDRRVLGTQKACLLTPEIAVTLSAVKDSAASYEKHLRRFLRHTSLDAIHWINFDRCKIVMKTLLKSSCHKMVL